jgi:hypothetical protein
MVWDEAVAAQMLASGLRVSSATRVATGLPQASPKPGAEPLVDLVPKTQREMCLKVRPISPDVGTQVLYSTVQLQPSKRGGHAERFQTMSFKVKSGPMMIQVQNPDATPQCMCCGCVLICRSMLWLTVPGMSAVHLHQQLCSSECAVNCLRSTIVPTGRPCAHCACPSIRLVALQPLQNEQRLGNNLVWSMARLQPGVAVFPR